MNATPAGCDLDHELRYPDGPTAYWNLSAKSRRCHRAKHAGWQVQRQDSGSVSWTSPLGRTYVRPGVWTPPRPLPFDLVLPEVRTHVHDDHDPHRVEPNQETSPGEDIAEPEPETLGWDDEPPL